jgi:azurin
MKQQCFTRPMLRRAPQFLCNSNSWELEGRRGDLWTEAELESAPCAPDNSALQSKRFSLCRSYKHIGGLMATSKFLQVAVVAGVLSALSSVAYGKTCSVTVSGNDQMQFDKTSIPVAADCTEVELTLKHSGKLPVTAMGHNWVLTKTADFQPVANAGTSAGAPNSYVPKDDARVIASTKLVGGGESTTIKFPTSKLTKGGDYTFFCSFPGHWSLMKGKLVFGG